MRLANSHQGDLFGFATATHGRNRNLFANFVKALTKTSSDWFSHSDEMRHSQQYDGWAADI
jgi:hypothetical protein